MCPIDRECKSATAAPSSLVQAVEAPVLSWEGAWFHPFVLGLIPRVGHDSGFHVRRDLSGFEALGTSAVWDALCLSAEVYNPLAKVVCPTSDLQMM